MTDEIQTTMLEMGDSVRSDGGWSLELLLEPDGRIRELGDNPIYHDHSQIPSRILLPRIQLHGRTGWWAQDQLTGCWCWAGPQPPDITLEFALVGALKELQRCPEVH